MPLDDTALLERWKTRRDAEAFDEIVRRFADQVFGTCRRILRNDADAEEVAQECFLLLVRSGGEVRTSLGGWLHRAATTRSLDRIRHEARRRAREATYEQNAPKATEASWDDIQEHVDAAINQLPESTRDMIVAHFLGRKTHEEIAVELGMNRRAVSQRIQRGVASLRQDFARRGITLSAAALVPLLAANTSAAPASLKASLGKLAIAAGTAGPGGAVATSTSLIGSLLIMKTKLVLLLAAVGIVAASVFFASTKLETAAESAPPEASAEPVRPNGADVMPRANLVSDSADSAQVPVEESGVETSASLEALLALSRAELERGLEAFPAIEDPAQFASISGVVLDSNGYPIQGAAVTAIPSIGWSMLPGADGMIPSARSAADGRYRIQGIAHAGAYWVNAAKPGYENGARGTVPDAAVEIEPGMAAEGIDFTLARGITVHGRVLSANGQPVPHALVQGTTITGIGSVTMNNQNGVRTDENGEFSLGFDEKHRDFVAVLRVQSKVHGSATFPDVRIVEGDPVELRLAAEAVVHGRVTGAGGKPIAGATLGFSGRKSDTLEGGVRSESAPSLCGISPAVCDEEGRYAVEVDSGLDYVVAVRAEGVDNSRERNKLSALAPGEVREYNLVVDTKRMTVQGRLIGTPSGNPIDARGGCRITVFKDERRIAEEHGGSIFTLTLPVEEGAYRFQASYKINELVSGPMSEPFQLSLAAKNEVEVAVPDPQYFSLRAVDGKGNPVEGARVNVMTVTTENCQTDEQTNAEGRIEGPIAMPPDCGARIWLEKPGYAPAWGAIHENQSSGTVQPEDVIVLTASAGFEGDLADAEGNPVANAELNITITSASGSWPLETTTDGEGHFTVVDQAPAEIVDIEIVIKPQPGPVEFRVGDNVVTLPSAEGKEPSEPDWRVWSAEQITLEAKTITDLGNMSLVEEVRQDE